MVAVIAVVILFVAGHSIWSQELPKHELNIGVIIEANDDISRKVISLAIQNANTELAQYNYVLQVKTETLEENSSFDAIIKACNLLQRGLVAIISPISEMPSRHISALCHKFHIPHLITGCRFPESLDEYAMDIKLSPNCDKFASIIYTFITHVENWRDMIILYSTDNCILKYEHLLNQFELRFKMRQWVHHDLKKNKQLLREITRKKPYKYFLVDIPYWQITDFLIMASVHNMTNPQYSFIFTDWDTHLVDLAAFMISNRMNVTTFAITNQTTIDHLRRNNKNLDSLLESIIEMEKSSKKADIDKKFMSRPALLLDSINLLVQGLITLMRSRPLSVRPMACSSNQTWIHGTSLFNAMTSVEEFNGITGKLVFNEKAQRNDYNLSIMELTENGFQETGHWIEDRFTFLPKIIEPPTNEITNFYEPLRVTTIDNMPFVFYKNGVLDTDNYNTNIEAWGGFCIELLQEIGADLKLNFTIHVVKDKKFGTVVDNKTKPEKWNGMIGELISKEAELVVGPMTISYEREKVVDFTTPFMSLGLSILFLKPQKETPGLFSFLSPISPVVWVYIISAYIGVSIIIFLISHITPYEWMQTHPCDDNSSQHNQFTLLNSLWFSVGALVRQGLEFCPQASSTRMVAGAWWFFTLIIISTYTANLAAFLTIEQLILPIKSAEDLVNQTVINYGALGGGASEAFFEKALIDTYKRMYVQMKSKKGALVDTIEEGVDKVRNSNGKYAFLLESAMNDYHVQRDCNLMRVGDLLDSKGYGIGFPAGSPLRDLMTESILKLQKSQIIANLIHKWWNEYNVTEPCNDKEKRSGPEALNVRQVGGVFFLLGTGFIFAALVSIIELYVDYRQKRSRWKMPFKKFLKKELQFAMRFMSSSKKPTKPGVPPRKVLEQQLILEPNSRNVNDTSAALTNLLDHSVGKSDSNQTALSRRQPFTCMDSPFVDRSDYFESSHDTLPSIHNSKYLWSLNNNL